MNSMLILGVCALAGVIILPRYGLKLKTGSLWEDKKIIAFSILNALDVLTSLPEEYKYMDIGEKISSGLLVIIVTLGVSIILLYLIYFIVNIIKKTPNDCGDIEEYTVKNKEWAFWIYIGIYLCLILSYFFLQ